MNKELAAGSTLSHYRIVSKIGEGGMGEVYLAQDTKLDRRVALKVLPAEVASSRDRMERFVREAKSAAALNHPNIAHIYEIGESDGTHYIAMEFIDGETLREKIHRAKAPLPQLLKYLIQVAQGLSKAHAAGIVHRDLKPDNIMITRDDYAKVLDFGLAKLVEPERTFGSNESGSSEIATAVMQQPGHSVGQSGWDSGHSTPGMVIGTIGYMSPEQASGRVDEIDLRSDIFSFGCILFEAATGQRAFAGKDVLDSLHKIVHAPTPQLKDSNPRAPAELQRVVRRCLAKEREKRYQSIKELAIELEDLQQELKGVTESEYSGHPTPATSALTSGMMRGDEGFRIAVLPFKVRDADPSVEVLADGLSEEIVTGLSRFRYLSVVTSTSAARLKGETEDEGSLAAKRGTRYVLEGSIRKGGAAIRVGVQLVDTVTGAQLWSETYNRDLETSSMFAVQDDVAARIVATVADSYGVLVHSMRDASRQKDDTDLTPAEWQFQYFAYREQITPSNHAALKSRLDRAAKSDNRPSDLWACLAQVYVDEYAFGFPGDDGTSLDRALVAARRAVELDRANQFAMVALAQTHFFRQDLAAFGPAAERAMALNPLNTDALGILGLEIVHTAEFERGTAIVRHAMELNPNHAGWMHFAPLWDHFHKGEYEQALECANRVDVPGLFWPYLVMASACGHLGRRTEAEAAVRDLLALDPEFAAHVRSNVATWHFASGLMDPILDGLRNAGLSIPESESSDSPTRSATVSRKTERAKSGTDTEAVRANEGFWVAVLPFKYSGDNADLTALADGMTEEIVTGLSRFSYLRVIALGSTARYANQAVDIRSAGKELGARYVMEGSLRQAGARLRVAVQLVDTISGAHLWAETYDRAFVPDEIFSLQDDLVPRIVSTVADMHGVLPRSMSEVVRQKSADQMSPYEALLRSFGYNERFTPEDLAEVRACLERAVQQAPNNAECWAMLSLMYANEYGHWDNATPDTLDRSLRAARKAVEAAPLHSLPYYALAQALYFKKEFTAFRVAAERANSLNPMDGATAAFMGMLIAYSGDWERGCALSDKGCQLNPNHPGWYCYPAWHDSYRKKDYRKALDLAFQLNAPQNYYTHAVLAMCYAQLGRMEEARMALRDMLALKPNYAEVARELHGRWIQPDLVEQLMDGLRKAGLDIPPKDGEQGPATGPTDSSQLSSGAVGADEGFWVAVLPCIYRGSNADLIALAEGLTEEIVTGLSRFSYLKVIARGSTSRFANESVDVRSAGKELGARYVMEGSLRQSGTKLRLAVNLVDTATGAHLWAENYERSFSQEAVFELQDDLVPRIVSTVADQYGALVHSMSESLRGRSAGQYSAHEAMLRAFGYWERMTPEEHAEVRDILEAAVAVAPDHSDCLAELAMIYWHEYAFGYNLRPDAIGRARATAQRAIASAPTSHFAHCALATSLFFQKDYLAFRPAAERALALNRMDSSTAAILGNMIAYAGDWESGLEIVERAMQFNPHHAGWYHYVAFLDAYRKHDYHGALASALKVNMPAYRWPHVYLAAVYGQLGEQQRATAALRELHELVPNFGATAQEEFGRWLDAELTEHLIDGLRKAGLEIVEKESVSSSSFARLVSTESRAADGFWIAVLPFKFTGTQELASLAEGLSEEISTGLSRFSYLRVIARSSTARYASETSDVRTVGQELKARYVMEGSLRQAGSSLRVSVQLVDSSTGAQLWAETYDRQFVAEEIFALQDDLVPRIVSTAADINGVLPRSMCEVVCSRSPETLSPYEAVLRSFRYFDRVTSEELISARSCLEIAVEKSPTHADAWAMLALLYCQDYGQGFNLQSDSLTRGITAAERAVESGPSNHLAYFSLAQARFFQKDLQSFRNAAERAVALNPMDANSLAFMGELLTYVGDVERGLALAARAKQISPNHPGWFWYADFFHAYRQRDYRGALNFVLKANLPGHWGMHSGIAAAAGQLGDHAAAAKAIRDLLKLRPDFCTTIHNELKKWFDPELRENLVDGLRKAGLEITDEGEKAGNGDAEKRRRADTVNADPITASPHQPITVSSSSNSSLIKSIAVLPFQNLSVDPEQEFFADGITEEILNALAQIKELRVAGRSSSFSFKGRNEDLRSVGAKLNVTSILEGTLRRSGDRLRITAQLIDAVSGYQLWSERYDRVLEDIFDVQDEIALAVVDALKLTLFGDAKEAVVRRYTDDVEVHELFLKGRYYSYKYTAEGWTRAVEFFEKVIEKDPDHAPAYAGKAAALGCLWFFGLSPADEAVPQFRSAATKAIELDGNLAGAHLSLGMINFFHDWEWEKAEQEFKQAILLNPKDAEALSYYAMFLGFVDRFDEAMALARRALEVDPLSLLINMNVGWTYLSAGLANEAFDQARKMTEIEPGFFGAYWLKGATRLESGDYEEAIEQLTKAVSLGGHPIVLADLGAAYALAGKKETAEAILDQLLDMRRQSYVPAICLARVYSRLGELEKTIQWLETAFEERNGELVFLESEITSAAQGDSLNSLGKDPRVMDLLERMKLPTRELHKKSPAGSKRTSEIV